MRFDNAAAQIQADAHAFCLGGEKSLEQVAEHLFTQPIATIAQHELHHVFTVHAGVADIQLHLAALNRHVGVVDGFGGVFQQIDQHLLDQDAVGHDLAHIVCNGVHQAHLAAAHFDFGQLHGVFHHLAHRGSHVVGGAALDEGADALNDLPGALRLAGGFFQRLQQVLLLHAAAGDAVAHAAAIVVDGGQGLVEFMRHAGSHLAHRDQAAGGLRALFVLGAASFGQTAGGDVGRYHQLRQPTIGPFQITRAHFHPALAMLQIDFCIVATAGKQPGWQRGFLWLAGRLLQHVHMGVCLVFAKPLAVAAVGKQQFFGAQRGDRDGGVDGVQHAGKTFLRGLQLASNALGFGDVGHGRHPAVVLAVGAQQGRQIHAGIKHMAVFVEHADFVAAPHGDVVECFLQNGRVVGNLFRRPEVERRRLPQQLLFAPARHLAKTGIDVSDAALQIERPHAGLHGIFHGATKVGFCLQHLLRVPPPAPMEPVGNQHPARQHAQGQHQQNHAVAQTGAGAMGLQAQRQAFCRQREGIGRVARQ